MKCRLSGPDAVWCVRVTGSSYSAVSFSSDAVPPFFGSTSTTVQPSKVRAMFCQPEGVKLRHISSTSSTVVIARSGQPLARGIFLLVGIGKTPNPRRAK